MAKEKEAKKIKKSNSGVNRIIKFLWISFIGGLVFVVILFNAISAGWLGFMPSFAELENPKSNLASEIYSADQVLLGKYYIENRSNIHFNELSHYLVEALVATEDARFYEHSGIDLRALARVLKGVVTGNRAGGGSTVTQQLAKNLFPREKLSKIELVSQKFKEWVIAVKLEYNYTKNEIIAMYLNTVTFGSNTFGIKTASKTYFAKLPSELNREEASMLVGMLKAPSYYNPVRNHDRALNRREVVLSQQKNYNYITEQEYDSLRQTPLDMSKYKRADHKVGLATYFREFLRGRMKEWCKNNQKADGEPYNLYRDGLKIYTTIDSRMQQYAEEAVDEHLGKDLQPAFFKHWKNKKRFPNAPFYRLTKKEKKRIMISGMKRSSRYYWMNVRNESMDSIEAAFNRPAKMSVFSWNGDIDTVMTPMDSILYYKTFLQTGVMSVEPHTGYVRAYVGGIDYYHFQYDHVTKGKRQVGSTFKPFVYASAMQEIGYSPCTEVPNVPVTFQMPDGQPAYTPKNSGDDREGEMVTLQWALANSVNYVSAFLINRVKPAKVIEVARKMGVTSDMQAVPAICLGTPSLSVYEMVGATATYPNKGVYQKPIFITRIEDKNGNVIETFNSNATDALDEVTSYKMLSLMEGVVKYGTGIRLRTKYKMRQHIAGKTGTTDNNSDGWFMGLTPDLVTGVWVGAEDRSVHFRSTHLGQGANMALPIWALYMKRVYADTTLNISQEAFEMPEGFDKDTYDCDAIKEQQEKIKSGTIEEDEFEELDL
ncbi:MAG: transglycosylase domain-containing protein [Bacteroidales bacterium]|nr:transglycosylase domain-containing protein [Bacteroidales bacterium]